MFFKSDKYFCWYQIIYFSDSSREKGSVGDNYEQCYLHLKGDNYEQCYLHLKGDNYEQCYLHLKGSVSDNYVNYN